MRENELLSHIYRRSADLSGSFAQVVVGPGDDCAVVRTPTESLLKVDQVIEGRHFVRGTPIDLIARKAIARPVSDVAAMAGRPLAALASASIPESFAQADALFDACAAWARRFGCPLVGGDISATSAPVLSLSISVLGTPHARRGAVLRSSARPGDSLWVTGELGGSFGPDGLGRHLTFEPRVEEASWLADTLGPSLAAMLDVSDGLGMDAGRLASASGVGIRIERDAVPVAPGANGWAAALGDGEDYELLFCVRGVDRLPETTPGGTRLTRIGTVVEGSGCRLVWNGGEADVAQVGFEHGRRP